MLQAVFLLMMEIERLNSENTKIASDKLQSVFLLTLEVERLKN